MTEVQNIFTVLFIVSGIFFMFVGSTGVVRLPDFYSRTHAVSTSDTLGIIFVITGLIVYTGFSLSSLKLAFIVLFVALSNPIGTHALTRAAYRQNVRPMLDRPDKRKEDRNDMGS
ncbi:MAG: monovalent cation/H(+) antiporter subunit G [Balneolaceae bacterium]